MEKQKFYRIGEISKMVEVPTHILRYWEKEFAALKPMRDRSGNRLYAKSDVEKIKRIRFLVYNKGYRIKGAKKELREGSRKEANKSTRMFLKIILKELQELKKCLQ